MFSIRNRSVRHLLAFSATAALLSLAAGCGGGSGGPQVNPTATPTTIPVAANRIAWMSDRDGAFHLYVMNGDGTGQVRLTKNTGLERSPSWSKDGKKLVFSYAANNVWAQSEIYSINSDGTGLTRLTNNNLEDNSPALSPDGQYVVWAQGIGNRSSIIYIAPTSGGNPRRLSEPGEVGRTPTFDPQGRVVYAAINPEVSGARARYQIMRINSDGTDHTQLTSTTSNLFTPSVSPDGSTLLYVDDESDSRNGDLEIYTTPVDTFAPTKQPFSTPGDLYPAWTPAGRIVFSSARDGNNEIYIASRNSSAVTRLTNNSRTDQLPAATGPSL